MSVIKYNLLLNNFRIYSASCIRNHLYSTVATNVQTKENPVSESTTDNTAIHDKFADDQKKLKKLAEYRFIFPEFLANPQFEYRHKIKDKLERLDMLKRRSVIHIPEFYVGSVLAVTATDTYSPGKKKRFVGICIYRCYNALRAGFVLRNIVDNQGIEILYDLYNPLILSIEVLKLEKRLDEELYYLRDALPEYSTFDFDMEPVFHPEGEPVPVNPLKVKLKPWPWQIRWEKKNMRGIESVDEAPFLSREKAALHPRPYPWDKYDLMKEYRKCITEEEQLDIWQDVEDHKHKFPTRQQVWKKNLLKVKPK